TAGELRRTGRALTGAAGALLPVRLLAAAGDLAAGLRLVRALATRGQLRHHDLVDQRHVDLRAEDVLGKLDGAGLAAARVEHVDAGHFAAPFLAAVRTRTRLPLAPGIAPLMRRRPFSTSTA